MDTARLGLIGNHWATQGISPSAGWWCATVDRTGKMVSIFVPANVTASHDLMKFEIQTAIPMKSLTAAIASLPDPLVPSTFYRIVEAPDGRRFEVVFASSVLASSPRPFQQHNASANAAAYGEMHSGRLCTRTSSRS